MGSRYGRYILLLVCLLGISACTPGPVPVQQAAPPATAGATKVVVDVGIATPTGRTTPASNQPATPTTALTPATSMNTPAASPSPVVPTVATRQDSAPATATSQPVATATTVPIPPTATRALQAAATNTVSSLPSPTIAPRVSPTIAPSSSLPSSFDTLMTGTIGDKYPIHMLLIRNSDQLFGQYFYDQVRIDTGYEQYLSLQGTADPDGQINLTEMDLNGNTTGTFKGTLSNAGTGQEPLLHYSGTWTSGSGDRALPFAVEEPVFAPLPGTRVISHASKEELQLPKASLSASYPAITGVSNPKIETFNNQVQKTVMDRLSGFKQDVTQMSSKTPLPPDLPGSSIQINYTIMYAGNGLISIRFTESTYISGAAHPNSAGFVINYDLNAGKLLALSDLFRPNGPYLQTIATYSSDVLKKHIPDFQPGGAGPTEENYKNWNIDQRGLIFTFDPYQVAAYVYGTQRVFMPYTQLQPILKPDGPLSPILK